MTLDNIMNKLFGFTRASYYNWLREGRIIIIFINNYFTKTELEEIVNRNGKLEKLEIIKHYSLEELKEKLEYRDETDITFRNIIMKLENNKISRASLLYLLNILLHNNKVKDHKTLFKFLDSKLEPKSFLNSLMDSFKDFKIDFNNDNIIRKGFAQKLYSQMKEIFTINEIDFIIGNKISFINMIEKKLQEIR